MKIAIVTAQPGSAIDNAVRPVARELGKQGVEVDLLTMESTVEDPEVYDLVHYGFFNMPSPKGLEEYEGPKTANVWHVPLSAANKYFAILAQQNYDGLVVDDTTTYQLLGQMGFTPTMIAMVPDLGNFSPLPIPLGPFTVGFFGSDFPHKRYEAVRLAAQEAGVQCLLFVTDRNRATFEMDPISDVYAHLHVLIHASYVDTNSQPVMEALRCGRPVIATMAPRLKELAIMGGIELTDGSVKDIAAAICRVKAYYEMMREYAIKSLPDESQEISQRETAKRYHQFFLNTIEAKS